MPEESVAGLRSFWSGAITFGLVSVPVALFPANRGRSVSLRMVTKDGTPLQRRYVCSKDGKQLEWDDIVRGYEVKPGKFVTVTDEELDAVEPRKSREIDLQLFVDEKEIDPKYFERAYYLVPAGGSTKGYRLLAGAMEESGRAGIATFVMRAKEYMVAIFAEKGILRAETLRFEDEIRDPKDAGLPKKTKPKPAAVTRFAREIGKHSGKVNFRDFFDDYARRLEKLAEKKQRAGKDVVKVPLEATAPVDEEGAEVIDLLEVLKKSLKGGGAARPRGARSSRKSPSARRRKAG